MQKKRDENDTFSREKIAKLRKKYPELNFSTYCMLREIGLKDTQIKQMYVISNNNFQFFKNNHTDVLKKVRNWA